MPELKRSFSESQKVERVHSKMCDLLGWLYKKGGRCYAHPAKDQAGKWLILETPLLKFVLQKSFHLHLYSLQSQRSFLNVSKFTMLS